MHKTGVWNSPESLSYKNRVSSGSLSLSKSPSLPTYVTRMIVPASIVACLACITCSDNQSGTMWMLLPMSIKLSQKCNSSGKKRSNSKAKAQDTGAPYGMSKQFTTQFLERRSSQTVKYCFLG